MPYQQNFQGELDGTTLFELQKKVDRKKKSLEDRMDVVDSLLESTTFYTDYFTDHFKADINCGDSLSSDINVCRNLEMMANYILNSDEMKELDHKEKPVYVFHKSNEKFEKKLGRESISIKTSDGSGNLVDSENVVHAVLAKPKNSRLPKTQTITKADLEMDNECGRILRDYQVFLDHVSNKLSENKPDRLWRYYSSAKAQIKDDMIMTKDFLIGVWGYDTYVKESNGFDYDIFDFTDFETVKALLPLQPNFYFEKELWEVCHDLDLVIAKANMTTIELEIINALRAQWQIKEIAEAMGEPYAKVRQTTIPRVIKKIIKVGERYDAADKDVALKIQNKKDKILLESLMPSEEF